VDDNDRSILGFVMVGHAMVHVYEFSVPTLMIIWLSEFSTNAAVLGSAVAVGYGLFGVGALPGGLLVDRFGSRPLIVACLAGMAGAFAVAGAAGSLASLAVAVGAWGVFASVYHPAGLALLSNAVEDRGIAMGYHGMGGNLGIALGPLATALLLLRFDWRTVALALTVPAAVVAVSGLFVDLDSEHTGAATPDGGGADPETNVDSDGDVTGADADVADPDGDADAGRSPSGLVADTRTLATLGFGLVLLVVTLNGLYYRAFLTFLPDLLGDVLAGLVDVQLIDPGSPYAEEFDVARYLYVAILTVGVAGQYAGGRLADRVAPERALSYVLAVLAGLALAFVPATGATAPFLAVALLLGVALFAVQPLSQATVAAYSAPEARGLSFGFTYLAVFGVGALGASLAGAVLTYGSVRVLFVALATVSATGAGVAVVLTRVGEPRG